MLLNVKVADDRMPLLADLWGWLEHSFLEDDEALKTLARMKARDLVRLESHHLGYPALLLVSMTIYLWDRLPSHAAITFIAFITSPNMLLDSN